LKNNLTVGYARVSTEQQELSRQLDALNKYGVDEIYTEKLTGTKASRPELGKVKLRVRHGDVVVIESLSRLGRSSKDLLTLIDDWNAQGVQLVSLKENIDSTSPTGRMLITVLSAICQFERDITVQRTVEGLQAARSRGRAGGRPPVDKNAVDKAIKLYRAQTHTVSEITELTGVSQATLYRYLSSPKTCTK